jgi:hypothetical protein
MGSILCLKPNFTFPCGVRTNGKFLRKKFNTILNPKLNIKSFVYKDLEIDFKINQPILLLDVTIRILRLYPAKTDVILTIPINNKKDPIKVEKTFLVYFNKKDFSNEQKHIFNENIFLDVFDGDEKKFIAWSGEELKRILEDESNLSTIKYINHYNKKNNLNLTHDEFVNEIMKEKMKLHKVNYADLNKMQINVNPETYNEMEFTFRYITFEEKKLEEYGDVEM